MEALLEDGQVMTYVNYLKKFKNKKLIKILITILTLPIWLSFITILTEFIFKLGVFVGSFVNIYTNYL